MSPMEVWSNESQERYVLSINSNNKELFTDICKRERCPFAVVGKTTTENIDVDKKIIEAGHHHGSTYYEHLAFLKAIESTSAPEVSLEDGLIAVAMGEAAEKSIKQGRLINLEEIIN